MKVQHFLQVRSAIIGRHRYSKQVVGDRRNSEGTGKEAMIEQGRRRVIYWLISSAVLISLLVGILCLIESVTPRTDGNDQAHLATEGAAGRVEVTFGEAIQGLGLRR